MDALIRLSVSVCACVYFRAALGKNGSRAWWDLYAFDFTLSRWVLNQNRWLAIIECKCVIEWIENLTESFTLKCLNTRKQETSRRWCYKFKRTLALRGYAGTYKGESKVMQYFRICYFAVRIQHEQSSERYPLSLAVSW